MTDINDLDQTIDDDNSTDDQDGSSADDNQQVQSPANSDSSSASGHAPDLEVDDDVDELGAESGLTYREDEELGIDHKVSVNTRPEPPSEDTPS